MSSLSMAASQGLGKHEEDAAFAALRRAREAIKEYGREKVVNASIGTLHDDEERFVALATVAEVYRRLQAAEIMDYAPISGLPEFLEAAIDVTFRNHRPEAYIKSVATPGGCGAIRHVFQNYAEQGEAVLIPDWAFTGYISIAGEHLRRLEQYQLFNPEGGFNLLSLQKKVQELLKVQDNLVIVFNTPAHNPTGYSITLSEWEAILTFIKDMARDRTKKIIVLVDIAYLDYAGDLDEVRRFMPLFGKLPDNILSTFAFSMSKSFTSYGMRCGALIGVSKSQEVINEFFNINAYSNRGTWSNVSRGAQRLLVEIARDPALMAAVDAERMAYRQLLDKRASIFLREAQEVDLPICPYKAGFFISVPAADPETVVARLQEKLVYAVPMEQGVRFALCSVATPKIPGLATRAREVMSY